MVKRAIRLEEDIIVDERVELLVVLRAPLILDDILIEDAIGTVEIHH